MSNDEPACAMYAEGPAGQPRWFYPDDLGEARDYASEHGAMPYHPWPEPGMSGPFFPWTREQVLG